MSKIIYVGPTITGVGRRNTIYNEIPDTIQEAAKSAPFFLSLCIPISALPGALKQIADRKGAMYTFYCKALEWAASNCN